MNTIVSIATFDEDEFVKAHARIRSANHMLATLVSLLSNNQRDGTVIFNPHSLAECLNGVATLLDDADEIIGVNMSIQTKEVTA